MIRNVIKYVIIFTFGIMCRKIVEFLGLDLTSIPVVIAILIVGILVAILFNLGGVLV